MAGGHRPPLQVQLEWGGDGQIFWLLASAPRFREPHPLSRLRRPAFAGRLALGNCIQSQQRNCSRFSRNSSRRSTTAT